MEKIFNKVTGDNGEEIAYKYLKKKRYKILERNYRNPVGEIDIVAKYRGMIVFVEVKTRTSDYFGLPREAVDEYKQDKIRRVALGYLKHNRLMNELTRFDVIEILDGKVTHIENAF